eukprot:9468147-Pyramimonas_sp.AAC.1
MKNGVSLKLSSLPVNLATDARNPTVYKVYCTHSIRDSVNPQLFRATRQYTRYTAQYTGQCRPAAVLHNPKRYARYTGQYNKGKGTVYGTV